MASHSKSDERKNYYSIYVCCISCLITVGLERVASITTNYFKYAEAAVIVFSYDSQESFNILSQHMLEVLGNAENAKIFVCGNKNDLQHQALGPSDELIAAFVTEYQVSPSENMIRKTYSVSCKTGEGVHEMFEDIATILARSLKADAADAVEANHFQLKAADMNNKTSSCCTNS